MSTNAEIKLCCPECKIVLQRRGNSLFCKACTQSYPIKDGIPSFVDSTSEFYEGKFVATQYDPTKGGSLLSRILANSVALLSQSHLRYCFFKRTMAGANNKVLDVGCGGGNQFLAAKGEVWGIDVSANSLKRAERFYSGVAQANCNILPFAGGTFDYVVSQDLLGHIPSEQKSDVLSEMYRILKRGGRTIHAIEVDSQNKHYRFAKRFPELYKKWFLDLDGHYGLEPASSILNRFVEKNFKIVKVIPVEKSGLVTSAEFIKRFDNEYRSKSFLLRLVLLLSRACEKIVALKILNRIFVRIANTIVEPFLPLNCAQVLLVCYEK